MTRGDARDPAGTRGVRVFGRLRRGGLLVAAGALAGLALGLAPGMARAQGG